VIKFVWTNLVKNRMKAMFGEMFGQVLCPDVSENKKAPTQQISGAV